MGRDRLCQLRCSRFRWPVLAPIAVAAASLSFGMTPASETVQAQATPTTAPAPSPAPSSSWTIIPSPDTASSQGDDLTSVSCTPGPVCMAVGHSFRSGEKTLAESWDGTAWSIVPTPDAGDTTNVLISNVLNAVSCISADACTSVGEYVGATGWQTLIESWDGSAWSIVPSPNSSPALGNYLDGVSCLSATFCTAVGSFTTGHGDETLVESWDGSTWSIVASPDTGYIDGLFSVSCTSPSACTAVGETRPRFGFDRTLVETWDGKAWAVVASPDASASTNVLNDVSCPTAAECVAVGTFFNGGEYQLLSMSWDGSSWSLLPNPGLHADGTGVTCSSATACTEVGASGLVNTWDGRTWTLVPTPASPDPVRRLNAISCLTSWGCMAVGYYTEASVSHTFTEEGCASGTPTPTTTSAGLPAGTGGNGPSRADADLTPASALAAACLQVFIKIVGPIPNVGTRSGMSVDSYAPDDGPVNFTKLTGSAKATPLVGAGSTGQQCVSGCANILIKVVNKATKKPATNTEVDVSLGPIDTGEAPALHQQGTQFLCPQTDSSAQQCGTSLDGLKTDEKGYVRLLYWAPGELVAAHVELYAQACTPAACALKRAKSKITVYPYRIFHYQGELKPETVAALVEMVREEGHFDVASHAAEFGLEAVAKAWIDLLGVESHVVELVLGPIGFAVAFTLIDLAHATSELLEEAGLRGAFFDASGLSEAGLKTSEFAKVFGPGDAVYMESQVLNVGKVFTLSSGWLWQLAQKLAKEYPFHTFHTVTDVKPEPLDLSVYETSYCSQYVNPTFHSLGEEAHCGPGYGSVHSPNIRTDLCIYITQLGSPTCGIQYDAPIWVVSQKGLDEHLHHAGALDTSLP